MNLRKIFAATLVMVSHVAFAVPGVRDCVSDFRGAFDQYKQHVTDRSAIPENTFQEIVRGLSGCYLPHKKKEVLARQKNDNYFRVQMNKVVKELQRKQQKENLKKRTQERPNLEVLFEEPKLQETIVVEAEQPIQRQRTWKKRLDDVQEQLADQRVERKFKRQCAEAQERPWKIKYDRYNKKELLVLEEAADQTIDNDTMDVE